MKGQLAEWPLCDAPAGGSRQLGTVCFELGALVLRLNHGGGTTKVTEFSNRSVISVSVLRGCTQGNVRLQRAETEIQARQWRDSARQPRDRPSIAGDSSRIGITRRLI